MIRPLAVLLLLCPVAALAQTAPTNVIMAGGQSRPTTPTVAIGASRLATGQVSVTTAPTLVAAARPGRFRVLVTVTAANTCAFGNAGVTTATGFPLQPVAGATVTLNTSADVYAACSATTTVGYVEEF
jgi:hypothetical protein